MKHIQQLALLAATVAAALAMPVTRAGAFAGDNVAAATDPGFVPNSGQINRGFDPKLPTTSQSRPIPTPAQARAAKMMPDSNQPSPGPQDANANATTGTASSAPAAAGPIGATGQTMPAKFSKRNDTLDRVPIMALPLTLSDQDRQRIHQAAMADKTPAATDAAHSRRPANWTPIKRLNETHPLPASVRGIPGVQALGIRKDQEQSVSGRARDAHRGRRDCVVSRRRRRNA